MIDPSTLNTPGLTIAQQEANSQALADASNTPPALPPPPAPVQAPSESLGEVIANNVPIQGESASSVASASSKIDQIISLLQSIKADTTKILGDL